MFFITNELLSYSIVTLTFVRNSSSQPRLFQHQIDYQTSVHLLREIFLHRNDPHIVSCCKVSRKIVALYKDIFNAIAAIICNFPDDLSPQCQAHGFTIICNGAPV